MSKVPTRVYCSSCKKCSHGISNCKGGNCSCKCRNMTQEELDQLQKKYHDEIHFEYPAESEQSFQEIQEKWRKLQNSKQHNLPEVKQS